MSTETHRPSITMTLKEAGDLLGMSQPILRKWISEGRLKTIRSSPDSLRRKITRDQLQDFIHWLESGDSEKS
jgi:excisionase family DNA binding protein